jgi:predicted metal-dependent enzyme (double-stranded beta helix superfamily)
MFDLDRFVADCRTALTESSPELTIKEILERAVSAPGEVESALGTPRHGEIGALHHSPELTILNVVWVPGMSAPPHNHHMWALIGLYGGQEDNTFYRREGDGVRAAGGKHLVIRDTALLGKDIIHSVTNPLREFTGAIHIYGGDFIRTPRSDWETGKERPFDMVRAKQIMAEANERWRAEAPAR